MKMPFGKFKGWEVCDIELGYLKWFEENVEDIDPELQREINHEIERRGGDRPGKGFVREEE